MTVTTRDFPDNARRALADEGLQTALENAQEGFLVRRAAAVKRLPEFAALCDQARDIKDHVLANLDHYLEIFEEKVTAGGGRVHWARDAAEARQTILAICQDADAKLVTKGKSMISEEIALNPFLEANGITPVETDLGEYIIQLRGETPSHIIAPAIHVTRDKVAAAFLEAHDQLPADRPLTEAGDLLAEARAVLRQRFLDADVGITGANLLVAETGTSVIVTNEGNGDLTQTLPRVHIVLASIEKIVPTLEDATAILRVLARSATGQEQSSYTTFSTGPRRAADPDGPEEFHVVLLDNGRAEMLGGEFRDMLRCIRCAACLNHCPVYAAIGGHAYGWVYPGPMGAVLTPGLLGLDGARHLPEASSLCGRCEEVCPVRIPLPMLLRRWRAQAHRAKLPGRRLRAGLALWAYFAKRPALYHFATGINFRMLGAMARKKGFIRHLPFFDGWTQNRDFPAPEGRTFMQAWQAEQGKKR